MDFVSLVSLLSKVCVWLFKFRFLGPTKELLYHATMLPCYKLESAVRFSTQVFLVEVTEAIHPIKSQLSTNWPVQYKELEYVTSEETHPNLDMVSSLGYAWFFHVSLIIREFL